MTKNYDAEKTCLTKADIANYLKISERHAARLMTTMKTISTGRKQRRVLPKDFDAWLSARRETVCIPKDHTLSTRLKRPQEPRKKTATSIDNNASVAVLAARRREKMARENP